MKRHRLGISGVDEKLWGPTPSREEVDEATNWHDYEGRRRLMAVLESCLYLDHAAHQYDVNWDDLVAAIEAKKVLAVNLGEAGYYLPTWQFDETQNDLVMNEQIEKLWDLWGKGDTAQESALGFCTFMTVRAESSPADM